MLLLMKKILTIKIKLIFFILIAFLISQKSNADFKIDYYRWLLENNQTVNLDKEKKLKRWLFDNKRLGEKFKWDSNPSLEKLHYQVFHFNKQHDDWDKHIIEGSNNPYKFKINLKENRKKLIKCIDKEV